jgi:prevent-host-death family protein
MKDPEEIVINTKQLRAALKEVIEGVTRGRRYTVLYRSRPAFRIVPVQEADHAEPTPLERDPLYRAGALGSSGTGDLGERHDEILYGP